MKKKLAGLFVLLAIAQAMTVNAQNIEYKRPPKVIEDIALAPSSPVVSISRSGKWMLQLQRAPYMSIADLAQPELKLAGVRINPERFCPSRQRGYISAAWINIDDPKTATAVSGLPEDGVILDIQGNPFNDSYALMVMGADGVSLYLTAPDRPQAVKMSTRALNMTAGDYFSWTGADSFVFTAVPSGIGKAPAGEKPVPAGPVVQDAAGKREAARTYQDLLKNAHDEALFEYYFTSQIVKVDGGKETEIGSPAIYETVSPSPDGLHLLLKTIQKPYSYVVPMYYFPMRVAVTDMNGKEEHLLADNPVCIIPMGYDTTTDKPRQHTWRADKPATVVWIEALDGGKPGKNPPAQLDALYEMAYPFTAGKTLLAKTQYRLRSITWGDDRLALLHCMSRAKNMSVGYAIAPGNPAAGCRQVVSFAIGDNYNNPGQPVTIQNSFGRKVLYTNAAHNELMLRSEGASKEGDMPYLAIMNIKTGKKSIFWRCKAPYYDMPVAVLNPAKRRFITARQSVKEPVNFFLHNGSSVKRLTDYKNPYPALANVHKELVKYKRADGLDLTATVYLPEGYDKNRDGRLPVLMWAYPREYRSKNEAAQVRGSKYRFSSVNYGSPVFWVTQGYCIMDNVEMPIVGKDGAEPNDNYIEQLTMDAEAAVKKIYDMGVGDTSRVAVGGHSYGAFMTANLLTHTRLFKAGIARSGAYNRTLTPFGFQMETRTYWEAPQVYNAMSPFMFADHCSGAMLLIHGEMDNNTGTFPLQSERFYNALKGNGAKVRYVVLPLESHGYSAKENILHMLWEENKWLEDNVKNAKK